MNRHIITILFLLAAVVLYLIGFARPATALVVIGMLAELAFWLRIIGHSPRSDSK